MRRYPGVPAAAIEDPKTRRVLEDIDAALKDIHGGLARIDQGYRPLVDGSPLVPAKNMVPTAPGTMTEIQSVPDASDNGGGLLLRGDGTWADFIFGDLTIEGLLSADQLYATTNITTDGTVTIEEGSIDATLLTGLQSYQLPDASGTFLLDAPSDGKYYVRKDGAWVEIIP